MRQWKAEFYKIRHTFLIPMHILVPVTAAGIFLAWGRISAQLQFSVFVQAIGAAFPMLASVISAGSVDLESPGHFQGFLMIPGKREGAFLGKWMCLQLLAFFAVMGAMLLYAGGNAVFLYNREIPLSVFLKTGLILWLGSLPLYLEHLFLNLRFSKAVSLAVSVGQLLISALFLTGLGDGKWQFVPSCWSARASFLYLGEVFNRKSPGGYSNIEMRDICICILLGTILCVIIFVWFHFYEGRQENE